MKWSELLRGFIKSAYFESNPRVNIQINIQKAPSSGNCKHCPTVPETILAGVSPPGKQVGLFPWFYLNTKED